MCVHCACIVGAKTASQFMFSCSLRYKKKTSHMFILSFDLLLNANMSHKMRANQRVITTENEIIIATKIERENVNNNDTR